MILFKSPNLEAELSTADYRLQLVMYALAGLAMQRWGKDVTVTSVVRLTNPGSVHAHRRGVDIRRRGFTESQIAEMGLCVNRAIIYGGGRVVFLDEPFAAGGAHIHLQVPNNPEFMPVIV